MPLNVDDAASAIASGVGEPLGLDLRHAAAAMFDVINVNMTAGIREVSVDRGVDPRDFLLVVVGGAGPVHAGVIASELGIPRILVPRDSAVFAAAGMLLADVRHDAVRALPARLSEVDTDSIVAVTDDLLTQVLARMRTEGFEAGQVRLSAACDMRYEGQFHEIVVEVPLDDLRGGALTSALGRFDHEHERLYGWCNTGAEVELVNLRVVGQAAGPKPRRSQVVPTSGVSMAPSASREAYLPFESQFRPVDVFDGESMPAEMAIGGPCIIELPTTTVFVPETYRVEVTDFGDFLLLADH